jgi:hypothetical protein
MYTIDYYTRPNGAQPAAAWLDGLDKRLRAGIMDKIQSLEEHGLVLLSTKMLKPVKGEHGLYELRAGQCRVVAYYDRGKGGDKFVLMNGFLKKKRRERGKIDEARSLLYEYLSGK